MKVTLKIPSRMLDGIHTDLRRPHPFAHERVGFMTAGATAIGAQELLLLARAYRPVADEDYVPDPTVGVKIGGSAMRNALEFAYTPRSTLLHIHTHGGLGLPDFSGVDTRSAREFVPGFFNAISRLPHGILVLSDDSASGLLWTNARDEGFYISAFVGVGAPYSRFGVRP